MKAKLLRVEVCNDVNDNGEDAWLVHSFYRVTLPNGRITTICIPDPVGWPTRKEARIDADDIRRAENNG